MILKQVQLAEKTLVIVIDPNGLGTDQPSVGFGFRMVERYAGIPNTTF